MAKLQSPSTHLGVTGNCMHLPESGRCMPGKTPPVQVADSQGSGLCVLCCDLDPLQLACFSCPQRPSLHLKGASPALCTGGFPPVSTSTFTNMLTHDLQSLPSSTATCTGGVFLNQPGIYCTHTYVQISTCCNLHCVAVVCGGIHSAVLYVHMWWHW